MLSPRLLSLGFAACLALPLSARALELPQPENAAVDNSGGQPASAALEYIARVDSPAPPGAFPVPRPFQAFYRMRWGEVDAARAEVAFTHSAANEVQVRVVAATTGMARSLWQMDATHVAVAKLDDLRPVQLEQHETRSSQQIAWRVGFDPNFIVRQQRTGRPGETLTFSSAAAAASDTTRSTRRFELPALRDMLTTFLYLRSHPLTEGESHMLALMSAKNPYLASARVVGRETIQIRAGRYPAIVLELGLTRIEKNGRLRKHKAFKSARAWISDDADRLLLKVDTRIFVGRITLELDTVNFQSIEHSH